MAEPRPLVSVCLLSWNQGALLAEAIESALNQEGGPIEIVVADDASSDESPHIISRYMKRYPSRIRAVLAKERVGLAQNANRALQLCRGDYVAFLAADDLFLPGKLAAQVAQFRNDSSVVLCYHGVEAFDDHTGGVLAAMDTDPADTMTSAADLLRKGGIRNGCSVAVRRTAIPKTGFDTTLNGMADWLFQIEVALAGRVGWLPQVHGRYRRHGSNMTNRFAEFAPEAERLLDILQSRYPDRDDLKRAASDAAPGVALRTTRAY